VSQRRGGSIVVVSGVAKTDGLVTRETVLGLLTRGWDAHLLYAAAERIGGAQPDFHGEMDGSIHPRLLGRVHQASGRRRRSSWSVALGAWLGRARRRNQSGIRYFHQERRRSPAPHADPGPNLDAIVIALNPEVVHCLSLDWGLASIRAASAVGAKVIMSVDGDELAVASSRQSDYRPIWEGIDVLHLPESGLWPLAERLDCPREKVLAVIPPAVAAPFLKARPAGTEAVPWADECLRILSVGALRWDAGYEYALKAVKLLLDRGAACKYRVVGDGEYAAAVAFARDQLELGAATEIVPPADLEALRADMAWADVYLSAGVIDGGARTLVQAQAMGLPVVATSGRGVSRGLLQQGTGFVVPRRNPAALADKLELLRDNALRRRMGDAARAVACERFAIENHVTQLDELYRRTLAGEKVVSASATAR
jgi:glycosyltransferase involved in cell wall biosynthesis